MTTKEDTDFGNSSLDPQVQVGLKKDYTGIASLPKYKFVRYMHL